MEEICEDRLREYYIGRYEVYEGVSGSFEKKRRGYKEFGVYEYYEWLKRRYREEFVDHRGYVDEMLVNRVSCLVVDSLLLRKSKGKAVEIPSKEMIESGYLDYRPVGSGVLCRDSFRSKGPVSYSESMEWIYQHLEIKDVQPSECPDSGTWGYYQMLLADPDARLDFYKSVYPKVAREKNLMDVSREDDRRERFEVLDRIIESMQGVSPFVGGVSSDGR